MPSWLQNGFVVTEFNQRFNQLHDEDLAHGENYEISYMKNFKWN